MKSRIQAVIKDQKRRWESERYNHIRRYLQKTEDIIMVDSTLGELGLADAARSLLATHEQKPYPAIDFMQRSTRRQTYAYMIGIFFAKRVGNFTIYTPNDYCHQVMVSLAVGYPELAAKFTRLLLDALNNGYSANNGHYWSHYSLRYAAMTLEITSDWLGLPEVDFDKLGLDRDPVWGMLAADWRSPDPAQAQQALQYALDQHLSESAVLSREFDDEAHFSFMSPYENIYPAEILAVLNLRRSLGLENPVLNHPLMQTPYAKITAPLQAPEVYPEDEIMDALLKEMAVQDPDYLKAWQAF